MNFRHQLPIRLNFDRTQAEATITKRIPAASQCQRGRNLTHYGVGVAFRNPSPIWHLTMSVPLQNSLPPISTPPPTKTRIRRHARANGGTRRVDTEHKRAARSAAELAAMQAEVDRLLPAPNRRALNIRPAKPLNDQTPQTNRQPSRPKAKPDRAAPTVAVPASPTAPQQGQPQPAPPKARQAPAARRKGLPGQRVQVRLSRSLIRVLQQFSTCGHRPGRLIERSMWRDGDIRDAALILGITAPDESPLG